MESFSIFLLVKSIKIAPSGAVTKIAITLAARTNWPHSRPSLKAMAPIEAWTVALGRYDTIKKIISLSLYFSPIRLKKTPIDLRIDQLK